MAAIPEFLWNVSINFLLFYKNNGMLKTDIMLDYWLPYREKDA